MYPNAEKLLILSADMERFAHLDDRLGTLIDNVCSDELFEEDLSFVAAAVSSPNYADFMNQINNRNKQF